MPLAATTQVLVDGPRNLIVKLTGTDTIDPTLFSSIQPGRSGTRQWDYCAIKRVTYSFGSATSATLAWDATADVTALLLEGQDTMDFTESPLSNNSGAGKTGSLIVTKTGSAGMNVILWLLKRSTHAA